MDTYIQILFAICLVIVLFVVGFAVYNYEFLKSIRSSAGVVKEAVPIFEGIKDLKTTKNEVYNTSDTSSSAYRKLGPSYNQPGGTEYSYNFWLYQDNGGLYGTISDTGVAKIPDEGYTTGNIAQQTVLFVKGSQKLVSYPNVCGISKNDIMVKQPLVKLEQQGRNLTVELNTIQGIDSVKESAPDVCTTQTSNWMVANAHKLTLRNINRLEFDKKWIMVTIVVQDTNPVDPHPYRNKVRVRVYVNNLIELDKYIDGKLTSGDFSTIKENYGHLYVAPEITLSAQNKVKLPSTEKQLMLADLIYYNYALTDQEIAEFFGKGVPTKIAPVPGQGMDISDIATAVASQSQNKMLT